MPRMPEPLPPGSRPRRLLGRALRRAARPALAGPGSPVQELRDRVDTELADVRRHVDAVAEVTERMRVALEHELPALRGSIDERFAVQDEARAEVLQALEALRRRVEAAERAAAEPYLHEPGFELFDAPGAGRVLGFRGGDAVPAGEDAYAAFEDVFRGPEERVRELQRPYLAIIGDRAPVLDVGCGRGELLDLLAERGVEARGVDADAGMVARCRAKGHEHVEHGDGLALLESLDEGTLGTVFSAQVVEHLADGGLERLVAGARRALRPGGRLVAETVNPHAPAALHGFWLDPTHRRPIFPETLLTLVRLAGFASAYVFHPGGSGDVEADRGTAPAYAVVATR
jgi:SAM-dependent methyltransferase